MEETILQYVLVGGFIDKIAMFMGGKGGKTIGKIAGMLGSGDKKKEKTQPNAPDVRTGQNYISALINKRSSGGENIINKILNKKRQY